MIEEGEVLHPLVVGRLLKLGNRRDVVHAPDLVRGAAVDGETDRGGESGFVYLHALG
jgi:hypothetical protein